MKTHLKKVLRRNLTAFAVFAVTFVIVRALVPMGMTFQEEGHEPTPSKPALTQVERMFKAGDCWTGEAPADVEFPGHVVVMMDEGDEPELRGPKMVGKALEQIFDGTDHGIYRVGGFCR